MAYNDKAHVTMEPRTRKMLIPPETQFIGIVGDNEGERVNIDIPRWYDEIDLGTKSLYIVVSNDEEQSDMIIPDVTVDGDMIHLVWVVLARHISTEGTVYAHVRATDENGFVWQSLDGEYTTQSVNRGPEQMPEPQVTAVEQTMLMLAQARGAALDAAAAANAAATITAPPIIQGASGSEITLTDGADRMVHKLSIYGKTMQDGTPTMSTPVQMTHAAQDGALTVSIGEQSATIATVGGLRGVPITDDRAAYTHKDASGAKWYADSIERRENGTAVLVRRIHFERLTSTSRNWAASNAKTGRYNINQPKPTPASHIAPMCSSLQGSSWTENNTDGIVFGNNGAQLCFNTGLATLDEWKTYLDSNEVYLAYAMLEPEEIELTSEEAAALIALRTQNGTTEISNDADAHMEIAYIADTKAYIDNAVAAAIAAAMAL